MQRPEMALPEAKDLTPFGQYGLRPTAEGFPQSSYRLWCRINI